MTKVFGISGAQGAGKSTLLAGLEKRLYVVDNFKVSRAVQEQLGWSSLDRVMDSPESMMEFQRAVFDQKYKNDRALLQRSKITSDVILTERTFADISAYTSHWVWEFVHTDRLDIEEGLKFLRIFNVDCSAAHTEIYAGTLLLPLMPHVQFENDPNRAKERDASKIYADVFRFCEKKLSIRHPRFEITAKTTEDRVKQVVTFINGVA